MTFEEAYENLWWMHWRLGPIAKKDIKEAIWDVAIEEGKKRGDADE